MTATLVVVVPIERALRMVDKGGWKPGRTNGFTSTLIKEFESADAAMIAGSKSRSTWNVEGVCDNS